MGNHHAQPLTIVHRYEQLRKLTNPRKKKMKPQHKLKYVKIKRFDVKWKKYFLSVFSHCTFRVWYFL